MPALQCRCAHKIAQDTLDRANLPLLASALTFDLILAVIPLAFLLVAGLGYLLSSGADASMAPRDLIARFLPQHEHGVANDPFTLIERLAQGEIQGYRSHSRLTWFAIPLSIWFSTRVFAAMRACLSRVYQVRQRPVPGPFRLELHRGIPPRQGAGRGDRDGVVPGPGAGQHGH